MNWLIRPLKQLAAVSVSNVDKKSVAGEEVVRLVNYTDVYYGDRITPLSDLMSATASTSQRQSFGLRPGDVLITKDSESADDIGVPAFVEAVADDMVLGYHLALLRPRQDVADGRFLYWSMCSDRARDQLSTAATGVTRFGLRTDAIKATTFSVPAIEHQRAIADFLDTETARIDALISRKRRMIELLDQRWQSSIDEAVAWPTGNQVPVRRLVSRLTSGPRGWADRVGDSGAPFVRITNINRRTLEIDSQSLLRVVDQPSPEAERSRIRTDDVLVSITADIGSVAVARRGVAGGFISQHLALLRPERCEGDWLAYAIRGTHAQHQLAASQYGGTKKQLSLDDLAELRIPVPPPNVRQKRLTALRLTVQKLAQASNALRQQVALLAEHRQALITAAVTGELAMPGVVA